VTGYWTPSSADVKQAESGLPAYLQAAIEDPAIASTYARKDNGHSAYLTREYQSILENLHKYRRQYIGIVVDGTKRVFINCFPGPESGVDHHPYWTHSFVRVDDGGYWYWSIQYDTESHGFLELRSNGYA
jgi:hypothetical protein